MGPAIQIDQDFHGWLLDQASALRDQRSYSLDWKHLAEELESMAAVERRELRKQLKRLLLHLLKMKYQPEALNRHHSWRTSIRNARDEINDLMKDSPGIFRGEQGEILATAFKRAREQASEGTRLRLDTFPANNPWSLEEIMREDFFPVTQPQPRSKKP